MNAPTPSYRFDRFEARPAQRLLLDDGAPQAVGARAYDLLLALIERRDRVVPHDELLGVVWPGLVVDENNLRQHVSTLRKLLGAGAVLTVAGRGYRFGRVLEESTIASAQGPVPMASACGPSSGVSGNLPVNKPTLIGREADLSAVMTLLNGTHLLTLVGAGGVGKTRMALEVADHVTAEFPDGVYIVELAPVTDASLVVGTVASTLEVHEEATRPLLDTLLEFLRRRRMLLILDNCEHLIEACAAFAEQVLRCSVGTRTLATSREALGVAGEVAWRLPSLRTAPPDTALTAVALLDYPANRLFVERAQAVSPTFRLTPETAAAVVQICHQLDGIPLALELAAARVGAMRVDQVAERLHDRFTLLTRSRRTVLQRHQTLRSLIDWSHELLSEPERVLWRRLSQFAGGWTVAAAEAVCSAPPVICGDVLELLTHLVEKSLVVLDTQSDEPRYWLLETIREYGLEKLLAADELQSTRARHLQYFVDLAETIRPTLTRQDQLRGHAQAEAELDNLRLALNWSLSSGQTELGLRLFSSLTRFWYKNMHWKEMVGWQERLTQARQRSGAAPSLHVARSFYGAAMLATNYDPPYGRRLCEQCVELSRALDFEEGLAWSLMWMGYIDTRQRNAATAEMFQASLAHGRRIADPWRQAFLLAQALICYAGYEALMGRDESAEAMVAQCEAEMAKIGGDKLYIGHGRALLGTIAIRRGHFERAQQLLVESLALYRAVQSKFDIAGSLAQQGFLALRQNDPARALALFRQSLPLHRNYPTSPGATRGLAQLLIAYAACKQWPTAARLAGVLDGSSAADTATWVAPAELSGAVRQAYDIALASTRSALDPQAFAQLVEAGRNMRREEAIAYAMTGETPTTDDGDLERAS
ncbi:MAG: winged helix-turn-helix domain-containing protein [Burkholderiaceae bacterium]